VLEARCAALPPSSAALGAATGPQAAPVTAPSAHRQGQQRGEPRLPQRAADGPAAGRGDAGSPARAQPPDSSPSPGPYRKYAGGALPVRVCDVSDAAAAAAAGRRVGGSFLLNNPMPLDVTL